MIWGSITWDGAGPLAFIEPGESLDGIAYMELMKNFLLPFIDNWRGRADVIYQQDRAPCHVARTSQDQFANWGIQLSPWAPSSPDMNPIEYVWHDLKVWIRKYKKPKNLPDLKASVIYYWSNILTKEKCRCYISHVKKNMIHVHRVKGGPIIDKWGKHN